MSHSTWRSSPCGQRRGECREYLPEYTKEGDLILPKNWRSWVYVGSPLTRDALNNGMAGFPEYHNVDIEPGSYEIYKKPAERGLFAMKSLMSLLLYRWRRLPPSSWHFDHRPPKVRANCEWRAPTGSS